MKFRKPSAGKPADGFCLLWAPEMGLLRRVKRTPILLLCFLCGIGFGTMIPRMAMAQGDAVDQAKATPSATPRKPSKNTPVDSRRTAKKRAPKESYVDKKLEEGYQPLADLGGDPGNKDKSFTLGTAPSMRQKPQYHLNDPTRADRDPRYSWLDAGIADNPNDSHLYAMRAQVRASTGDFDGAMADCDHTIDLGEKEAPVYALRSSLKLRKGDLEGALIDLDQMVELDRNDAVAYVRRSKVKSARGDYVGALSDADHAVELSPYDASVRANHGSVNMAMGQWQGAWTDYHHCCELSDARQDYPRLFAWISQERLGQKEEADKELGDYLVHRPTLPDQKWVGAIGNYLLGNLPEPDLLKAASSPDAKKDAGQHCEAWYYVGIKKLLSGDQQGALNCFHQCLDTKQFAFDEYAFSEAELQRPAP